MERAGVLVNKSRLHDLSAIFHKDMQALEKEIHALAGREFNIASPAQLGVVLYDELSLPRHKSTDADALAELEHPIAAKVLEWRSLSKLAGTYADALPKQIASDGRIHTTYLQTSTNTGRLSSRDPNLQNIPIKTALGEQIRKCFVAPPGQVLISADYSQIQLRLLADVADVKTFKDTFTRGADIHEETARKIFGIAPGANVPKDLRAKAKTVNFSIIYGISSFGLATQLGVSRTEAQSIINSYLAGLPEVAAYFEKTRQFALENGYVYTPMGRRIELGDVRNPRLRAYALRAAINAPIQGFEADLMRLAMVKIAGAISKLGGRLIMQVHDEMVFECATESAPEFAARVKNVMETVMSLSVPLLAETTISAEWGK
jgi:DNA polymerase-1